LDGLSILLQMLIERTNLSPLKVARGRTDSIVRGRLGGQRERESGMKADSECDSGVLLYAQD
jgi:hypothetical protein